MSDSKNIIVKSTNDLIVKNREKMNVSGIKEIINFDENEINLKTICGNLIIDGEGLHINILNIEQGEIELVGKINGINYIETHENEKRSILNRIFK